MKVVEYEYVEINNISCIFFKMAAKMAAKNLNQMYFSSSFRYTDKQSVNSHEVKVLEYEYVEINNISCIFFKMAAKMAAENLNLIYFSSPFRYTDKQSVNSHEVKIVE